MEPEPRDVLAGHHGDVAGVAIFVAGMLGLFGQFGGMLLALIGVFGAFASYQERQRCRVMDVYVDGPWYWRDSVYRSDTAPARRPLWREIAGAFRGIFGRPRPRRRGGPLRILDAARPDQARQKLRSESDEAIRQEDFEREPQAAPWVNLALVYRDPELSQDADAADACRRALALKPDYERAKELLDTTKRKLVPLAARAQSAATGLVNQTSSLTSTSARLKCSRSRK